jgi:hypothetical protein
LLTRSSESGSFFLAAAPTDGAIYLIGDKTIKQNGHSLTLKEMAKRRKLKSGLHWGQMQVTKEKGPVKRALLLPVMACVLLLRLYSKSRNRETVSY